MRSAPPPLAGNSASVLGVGEASRALVFRRVLPRPVENSKAQRRDQVQLSGTPQGLHAGPQPRGSACTLMQNGLGPLAGDQPVTNRSNSGQMPESWELPYLISAFLLKKKKKKTARAPANHEDKTV